MGFSTKVAWCDSITVFLSYPHLKDGEIMSMSLPTKTKDNKASINEDNINLSPQLTRTFFFSIFGTKGK